MKTYAIWSSASALAMVLAMPAHAQEAAAATSDDASEMEIIVTGLKRQSSLQKINVAATVLSGDNLVKQGVERLDDLQNAVPGLSISDAGLTQAVNIRGIGLASTSPAVANGVATYFDGLFQPPIVSTNSFYDIQSVEVFRGPQGTFVGSNSTGGAIFITSKNPTLSRVEGYGQAELGNYSRMAAQGAVNIPVSDILAVRVAGNYRSRDSFYTVANPLGHTPGYLDEHGVRVGVLLEPSSNFRALFKAEIARKETGGHAYRPIIGTRYDSFRTTDMYKLNYDTATENQEKADQFMGQLEYETNGGLIVRSITGYQQKSVQNFWDTDGTNANTAIYPRTTQDQFVRERVWAQEINIISPSDEPFSWVIGGYYQRNKILVDIVNNPEMAVHTEILGDTRKVTTGLFAQATYDLSEQFSVEVGGRYSTFKSDGGGAVSLRTPAGLTFLADPGGHHSDNQFTGKVGLNWTPSRDHLFYGFIAKGYKSGGASSPTTNFVPETVIDYEIGWKGTLLDGAVTTQFGAFYYDYKNFQLDALDGITGRSAVINLTDAKVKGVEGQVQARTGGFNFTGSFSYTNSSLAGTQFVDSRLVAFTYPGSSNVPNCTTGNTPSPTPPYNCINYAGFTRSTGGGPNLFSPEWTYGASISYEIDLVGIKVTPRLDYAHVGARYTYIAYNPIRDRLAAYDLLNASIAFNVDRFDFELWATNLTKERYMTGQTNTNEFYGAPREYGLRMRVGF